MIGYIKFTLGKYKVGSEVNIIHHKYIPEHVKEYFAEEGRVPLQKFIESHFMFRWIIQKESGNVGETWAALPKKYIEVPKFVGWKVNS